MRFESFDSPAVRRTVSQLAEERLPSEADEVLDLGRLLWTDIRIQVGELNKLKVRHKKPRPLDERQLHSYCWALIVLQQNPAIGQAKTFSEFPGRAFGRGNGRICGCNSGHVSETQQGEIGGSEERCRPKEKPTLNVSKPSARHYIRTFRAPLRRAASTHCTDKHPRLESGTSFASAAEKTA
jgi:hypothetical protein